MKSIQEHWQQFIADFNLDNDLQKKLFNELSYKYNQKSRAYHNLTHIKTMLDLMEKHLGLIEDPKTLRCSIWYHDLIYNALKKDNELKSADHAKAILKEIDADEAIINRCYYQIMLTKTHHTTEVDGIDEKLMIDFDLEILSRDWSAYEKYTQQIRKEYWMYPGPIYRKGRREAMKHFLRRANIYQSELFRDEAEKKARQNIEKEVSLMGG